MPRPEDSGGPAPPRPDGGARVAFGCVQTLGVRTKPFRSCTSTSGCAVTPAAYRILCLRFAHLVRRVSNHDSAMDARLDTGGWLALTRQGLTPCKRRQACLGAITLRVRRAWKRERSGRWKASPARACSARPTAPSLKAVTAHRMTTSPVCGYRSLLGPIVQPQSWYLLEVTPIPGDQHHVLYQRRGRNAEIATAHTQPHGP